MKIRIFLFVASLGIVASLSSCFSAKSASSSGRGGEVVGVGGKSFAEPAPYGMVKISRGFLHMGDTKQDSLWGRNAPTKDI